MILGSLMDLRPVKSRPWWEGKILEIGADGTEVLATVRGATSEIMRKRKWAILKALRGPKP